MARQRTMAGTICRTHLAEFLIIMPLAKEELERLFTSLDGSPRQGRVPLRVRIRVTHVNALYETFHEEKVIFYQMRNNEISVRGCELWQQNQRDKREVIAHAARPSSGAPKRLFRPSGVRLFHKRQRDDGGGGGGTKGKGKGRLKTMAETVPACFSKSQISAFT